LATQASHFYSIPGNSAFPQSYTEVTPNYWPATDISTFLQGTVPFYQHLLGPPDKLHANSERFAHHLVSHTLLSCSNGYYDPQLSTGTHGSVFSTTQKDILLQSAGPTDGHPKVNSPYRSELSGLLAVLYITKFICHFHAVTSGSLVVLCDNKGALRNIFSKKYTGISPFLYTDFDLITEAQSLLV
jgi:hypothetical protein